MLCQSINKREHFVGIKQKTGRKITNQTLENQIVKSNSPNKRR